ncbi:MAG TPA: S41 family peptidase [Salinivirgaceae bacterium]|nr:S41 family peptidase [Salinivirgaceae bacterium]HQA76440.1 S41 family peptidase [Salinivirgaceae bacterium]
MNISKHTNRISKKLRVIIAVACVGLAVLFTGAVDNSFEVVKNLDIFYTVVKELDQFYVDEINHGKLIKDGIDKMLETLDPYTNYIPESKIEDLRFMTTGNYGGIGALIRKSGKRAVIADPYEGLAGQKAGLRAGDILLKIDDFDTENQNIEAISEKLKGTPGTSMKVLVERYGESKPIEFNVVREHIHINPIPYYTVFDNNIGYVQFNNFTQNCAGELKSTIDSLLNKGAKSLILDLRGNPGGLLDEAILICNLFLPKGQLIVSTKGKVQQWNRDFVTTKEPFVPKMPVVVLVNRGSASASEIVAGALQDMDRGIVMGTRTFGKGLVQTTRPLSYNAQIKLTTAKYYIPSGRCIQALDYSHRNEDGSVGNIPDSLVSEFTTKNGRKVYDGGGIKPDIELKTKTMSRLTTELYIGNHIFDFATQYASKHNSIDKPDIFSITDQDFADFIEFVKTRELHYDKESKEKLDELIESLKQEKYYDLVENNIKEIEEKIKRDIENDLTLSKDELTLLLNEEIASRYYYQRGRIQNFLRHDAEVDSARALFNNIARYNELLKGE